MVLFYPLMQVVYSGPGSDLLLTSGSGCYPGRTLASALGGGSAFFHCQVCESKQEAQGPAGLVKSVMVKLDSVCLNLRMVRKLWSQLCNSLAMQSETI